MAVGSPVTRISLFGQGWPVAGLTATTWVTDDCRVPLASTLYVTWYILAYRPGEAASVLVQTTT